MSPSPITVRLDPRRLDQLKAIGTAMNLSNAGVIASMIREKIAAGIIPASIPGLVVKPVEGGVSIRIDENKAMTYSREAALELASTIRGVVNGSLPGTVNMNHDFAVLRKGTGFRIQVPFVSPDNSFPADLAEDFAGLIEKATE